MALTNRISHNIFRIIAYTKKYGFEVIFCQEYFEDINVSNDLPR
jgi:hypothetical protein